jgi:hypothetical protein
MDGNQNAFGLNVRTCRYLFYYGRLALRKKLCTTNQLRLTRGLMVETHKQ